MIFNILNNKSLPVYGRGNNTREWIYVKDNCEAILKIFLKGKNGENYNVGTGIKLKNIDIVKEYFGYSNEKAKVALDILSEKDINYIKGVLSRGGKK